MGYRKNLKLKGIKLKDLAFAVLLLAGLLLTGGEARAQSVEGCDPKVEQTHQAKAQARVSADVNATEGIFQKPDSTLAMTCFNVLAGNDSDNGNSAYGGTIFSGNFSTNAGFKSAIEDALSTFYGNDFLDADGHDSNMIDYTQTTVMPNTGAPCGQIEDSAGATSGLWTRVKKQGIATGVPQVSVTDLLNGTTPPGAGTNYTNDWKNETAVDADFNQYKTAQGNETQPVMPLTLQTNSNIDTFCQVLIDANIPQASCP